MDKLVNAKEAGKLVGRGESTIRKWINRYNPPVHMIFGVKHITQEALYEMLGKVNENVAIIRGVKKTGLTDEERLKLKPQTAHFTQREVQIFREIIKQQQDEKVEPLYIPSTVYTSQDLKQWKKENGK